MDNLVLQVAGYNHHLHRHAHTYQQIAQDACDSNRNYVVARYSIHKGMHTTFDTLQHYISKIAPKKHSPVTVT